MQLGDRQKEVERFRWQHMLAWLGGVLCALVPFIGSWELGAMQVPVRNGPGYFGVNVLIVCGLCILGGVVGGYWWRCCKWLLGEGDLSLTFASIALFVLGVAGWLAVAVHGGYLYWVTFILVVGLLLAFLRRSALRRPLGVFLEWLMEKRRWNACYFALLFLVFNFCHVLWVLQMPVAGLEQASLVVSRFFTSVVMVGGLFLLVELAMRAAPKYFRWVPWLVVSMVPVVVVADLWMRMALGRRLMEFVNGLTASGDFDPVVELAASGLDMGPMGALMLVVGLLGGALAVAGICWCVSQVMKLRLSVGMALGITLMCWLCVVAEQGLGSIWKSVPSWQQERKFFSVHVGLFSPPEGLGRYRITFKATADGSIPDVIPELEAKPDVYIFMVESMRADALREDTTPFLWKMMRDECQPIEGGWAGSNATHLSWFTFFHSQVPVYWRGTLEGIKDRESYAGAPPLRALAEAGYDIQVRAVCDLAYKDFGLLNFGGGLSLASVVTDDAVGSDYFEGMDIPEREVKTFGVLRDAVNKGKDGRLFFTALDSPHYNYYWHSDFKPPFEDYVKDIRFPFNPDAEEVLRYLRRYWNSCAWIDYQIREFCEFLKQEGRYDDSIIIITGDHGEEFQESGGWCHCSSLQPEQTQVPLLIKWPKFMGRGPGQKVASHMDVMPTLLSALGIGESAQPQMAGANLLNSGELSAISTTAYAGKDGEAMVWRSAQYEAAFSWSNYWSASVPTEVVLERIVGPEGEILRANSEQYLAALRELFPDAFDRYIDSLEVIED